MRKMTVEYPLVSLIIPAYNEEKYIEKTLKSVKNQSYKKMEIIVVDNNSTDKTNEIAKKYADKVVVEKRKGVSKARNRGAKEAKGEILIFVDADTQLEKKCVENIVKAFMKDRDLVCAAGFVLTRGKILHELVYALTSLGVWLLTYLKPQFYGIIFGCRKKAFEKVGGFNEDLVTCEDLELTKKLSKIGKCKLVIDAVAFSSPRRLEKQGILRTVIFHALNFMRYTILKNPSTKYEAIR